LSAPDKSALPEDEPISLKLAHANAIHALYIYRAHLDNRLDSLNRAKREVLEERTLIVEKMRALEEVEEGAGI